MASPCPDITELEQLISGQMPDARRESLTSHLSECSQCTKAVAQLREKQAKEAITSAPAEPRPAITVPDTSAANTGVIARGDGTTLPRDARRRWLLTLIILVVIGAGVIAVLATGPQPKKPTKDTLAASATKTSPPKKKSPIKKANPGMPKPLQLWAELEVDKLIPRKPWVSSPKHGFLGVSLQNGGWQLFDPAKTRLPEVQQPYSFSADGMVVAHRNGKKLEVDRVADGGGLMNLYQEENSNLRGAIISEDGKWLAMVAAKSLTLRRLDKPAKIPRLDAIVWPRPCFSHDGQTLFTAGYDGTVRLWNTATGKNEQTWIIPSEGFLPVSTLALSPDGETLAIACPMDGTVRLWNTKAGVGLFILKGHDDEGSLDLDFSPDGKLIATSDRTGKVRLWQPDTGLLMGEIDTELEEPVVRFLPNGRALAAMAGGTVQLWQIDGVEKK